jgi:hypothetical protein
VTTSQAALTAPQAVWARTTISGEPRTAAPNSTVPKVAVSTRLPASRETNSSPTPWPPKMSSGGTRLSAQLMIVAQGAWPPATSLRLCARSTEQSSGWLTKRSLPDLSAASASAGESAPVVASAACASDPAPIRRILPARATGDTAPAPIAIAAAAPNFIKSRRPIPLFSQLMHIARLPDVRARYEPILNLRVVRSNRSMIRRCRRSVRAAY